jgi:hypothetical protein
MRAVRCDCGGEHATSAAHRLAQPLRSDVDDAALISEDVEARAARQMAAFDEHRAAGASSDPLRSLGGIVDGPHAHTRESRRFIGVGRDQFCAFEKLRQRSYFFRSGESPAAFADAPPRTLEPRGSRVRLE